MSATTKLRRSAAQLAIAALALLGATTATAQAVTLPDGRVYERLTPDDTSAQDLLSAYGVGDGWVQYATVGPEAPATAGTGVVYRATRTATGWQRIALNVPASPWALDALPSPSFNREYTAFWWRVQALPGVHQVDLWRSPVGGTPQRVGKWSNSLYADTVDYMAVSADGTRAAVMTSTQLVPQDTDSNTSIYIYDADGQPHLQSVKNDGTPIDSCGANTPSGQNYPTRDPASDDLRTVFFTTNGCDAPPHIYARVDDSHTVDVSPSLRSTPDPAGEQPRTFLAGAVDGSSVVFTTSEQLVDADTNNGPDLYRYDLRTDTLTLISRGTAAGTDAEVQGFVGGSDDLSHLYYVGTGQIDGQGTAGQPNLYAWVDGQTRLIGTASPDDGSFPACLWACGQSSRQNQVTPDGNRLVFVTVAPLSAADHDHSADVYGYDAATGTVKQLSAGNGAFDATLGYGSYPTSPGTASTRYVSDDGVFGTFQTDEGIDAHDANQRTDVYRWRWDDGSVALVSSGTGQARAFAQSFSMGVSPDGKDIYIGTAVPISPSDTNGLGDIYDARIGGGLPDPPQVAPCSGDACQGAPTGGPAAGPRATNATGSSGNVAPASRSIVVLSVRAPTAAERATAARSGRLRLVVRVARAGTVRATARIRLGTRRSTVATGSARAARAGSVTLTARISATARARLRRDGRLRLLVHVTGAGTARDLTVDLRRPQAPKTSGKSA